MRSKSGLGIALGAINPAQPVETNPGTPDSATVGSSGAVGNRRAVVTASPRSWPVRGPVTKEAPVFRPTHQLPSWAKPAMSGRSG